MAFMICAQPALADDEKYYCAEHGLGWNFYCDPKVDSEAKAGVPESGITRTQTVEPDPQAELKEIQERLEYLKVKAIMYPTAQNVAAYMSFQKEQLERASIFADQFQRVSWQNVELDYLYERPASTLGKRTWEAERDAEIDHTLRNDIKENYGLFFFFNSKCAYCHQYAPVLRRFANKYNLTVIAVSQDGKGLPDFPDFKADQGQSLAMGVKAVPATLLFDKKQGKVIKVAHGFIAEDELAERIYLLTQKQIGHDF